MYEQRMHWVVATGACLLAASVASAQPPWAGGGAGRGPDDRAQADRDVFHFLLEHRAAITRSVDEIDGGVETVTESADQAVAAKIREHAHAMEARLRDGRPIHRRDPLFAALFAHASGIHMTIEDTPGGVRVRETSADAYTVKLIRAHAEVVSRFLARGWEEVRRNHEVPAP
jgi:hypothetical protein